MPESESIIRFSDIIDDIRSIANSAWRFRWKGVVLAWVLCLIGWAAVMSMPNIYSASSRLFIDTQTSLRPLLQGLAVNTDTFGESLIMARSLTSRPNLERIAAVSGMTFSDDDPSKVRAVVMQLQNDLDISFDASQVLNISYEHAAPSIALSIVSQLIDLFIEGVHNVNRSDSDSAQNFLVVKIREYEELLNQAERRLAQFKKENIGLMPGERGDYFARLQQEQESLEELDLKLNVARRRQAELHRQLEGETPVFGMVAQVPAGNEGGSTSGAISRQIGEYEQELARLRIQYTDSHPDLVRIKGIIEDLRAQQIEERQNAGGAGRTTRGTGNLNRNPVFQSMRLQLSSVELKLVQLKAKRDSQAGVVSALRNKVDIIPDIEARLTKLNRDYEVNKAQYDALLGRLESARLTEAAEKSKNEFNFRIIDPPSVTPKPVGPNRVFLMTGVLVLALGAGLALAVLLGFTRPVFFSVRDLERHFKIPVLGGITYVPSAAEVSAGRKRLFLFIGSFVAIFGSFVFVVIFNQAGAELMNRLIFDIGSMI